MIVLTGMKIVVVSGSKILEPLIASLFLIAPGALFTYLGVGAILFGDTFTKYLGVAIAALGAAAILYGLRLGAKTYRGASRASRVRRLIKGYRGGVVELAEPLMLVPGVLTLSTSVQVMTRISGPSRFVITTPLFTPLSAGYPRDRLSFAGETTGRYVVAVWRGGEGLAVLPAYCSDDFCISLLDPSLNGGEERSMVISGERVRLEVSVSGGIIHGLLSLEGDVGQASVYLKYAGGPGAPIVAEVFKAKRPGRHVFKSRIDLEEPAIVVINLGEPDLGVLASKLGLKAPAIAGSPTLLSGVYLGVKARKGLREETLEKVIA